MRRRFQGRLGGICFSLFLTAMDYHFLPDRSSLRKKATIDAKIHSLQQPVPIPVADVSAVDPHDFLQFRRLAIISSISFRVPPAASHARVSLIPGGGRMIRSFLHL
jgi:hypothetical protein